MKSSAASHAHQPKVAEGDQKSHVTKPAKVTSEWSQTRLGPRAIPAGRVFSSPIYIYVYIYYYLFKNIFICFKVIYSCFAGAFGLVLSLEETFDTQIACGRCLPLEKSHETAWIPGHHRFPENHYAMNYWCSYFSAVSLIAVAASKTRAFLWTVSCSDFNNAMT